MNTHRAINFALAIIIAGGMSTAYLLDGPADPQAHQAASAASLADAKTHARQQARFERAARTLCGGGESALALLDDGSIQCFTHQGRKTVTAKVAL